ncbi:hypothetical protein BH09PSE3_BH09PSE3_05810 [soil metagenome]
MEFRGLTIVAAMLLCACVPTGGRIPAESRPLPAPASKPNAQSPPSKRAPLRDPRLDQFDTISDEKPTWEIRPVAANAIIVDGKRYHKVSAGETGIAIARAYNIPWSRIIAANAMAEPYVIKQGQRLIIPDTGIPTMEARARAFRLDIDDILTGGEPAKPARQVTVVAPAHFSGKFDWPMPGRVAGRFGPAGSGRFNQGIDIAAASGAAIRATTDGTVAFVGSDVPGYGGLILIRHGGGWISAYGHAATARVKHGTVVKRGTVVGALAVEAVPILHFELRRDRKPVDPLAYLPKR